MNLTCYLYVMYSVLSLLVMSLLGLVLCMSNEPYMLPVCHVFSAVTPSYVLIRTCSVYVLFLVLVYK